LRVLAEDELGIDTLVEVHTKEELQRAVNCGAQIIGVNNRDLRTFNVSLETSKVLARLAPANATLVSESGLNPQAVRELYDVGYRGFLVGESLMRAADPAKTLREFIVQPEGGPLPAPPWIKICGLTSLEDARAAISAGADMLGFNFYRPSPRFIEPDDAAEIIRSLQSEPQIRRKPFSTVGVFVNESIEEVVRIADTVGLNGIQLHGDESVAYCHQAKELLAGRFVIKAVAANGELELPNHAVDAIMLDAFDTRLRGGTGRLADWSFARELATRVRRVFLAGGLSPENVGEAIAAVRPYGVDACSSLEITPGRKSAQRMNEFVRVVRNVTLQGQSSQSMGGEGK
jgi:indole-3-glycerol phosphate synthase/phosphoribosylanthranilate isomerase/anthranilate synthase/indole-3-glycerol phosphate synthase/phosphoribosylanthranilate isomerase